MKRIIFILMGCLFLATSTYAEQGVITSGQTWGATRGEINANFTELYQRVAENYVYADAYISGSLTAGIQEAHDYAVAQGYDRFTIVGASGEHTIHKSAEITEPCTLAMDNTTLAYSEYQNIRTLTADASTTDTITVDSAANFEVGWAIAVWDTSTLAAYHVNHMVIESIDVSTNTITFTSDLTYAVTTADTAVACHIFNAINIVADDYEQFTISGLRIDGNSSYYDGTKNTNEHTWVQTAIYMDGNDAGVDNEISYIVENCRFENITHTAINAQGRGAVIQNNYFLNIGSHGIDVSDASPTVTGNYFENCGFTGVYVCLDLWSINITDNEFVTCERCIYGIGSGDLNRVPADIDAYHIIKGNHFTGTLQQSIDFDNYPRGIIISNNIFRNGNTELAAQPAIGIYKGQDIIISDNIFVDDQASSTTFEGGAILLSQSGDGGNIVISDNVFKNWAGDQTTDNGVITTASSGFVLSNNVFEGIFLIAAHLSGGNVTVIGNRFKVTHSGSSSAGVAFKLEYGITNVQIIGNRIDAQGTGIWLYTTDGVSGYNISNNVFSNCTRGIRTDSTKQITDLIFMGNVAEGCTQDYDFEGNYPASYKPDIGGADFKADVEQFNIGTVTTN